MQIIDKLPCLYLGKIAYIIYGTDNFDILQLIGAAYGHRGADRCIVCVAYAASHLGRTFLEISLGEILSSLGDALIGVADYANAVVDKAYRIICAFYRWYTFQVSRQPF